MYSNVFRLYFKTRVYKNIPTGFPECCENLSSSSWWSHAQSALSDTAAAQPRGQLEPTG